MWRRTPRTEGVYCRRHLRVTRWRKTVKHYSADRIRNVGLFSHGGAGKTSLTEALLFDSKAITRLGRVEDGNTVADFDPDEIKRHISVNAAVAPVEWGDTKIN